MKTVVVINDFTTCEEIALGIQMPILRDMGHKVLPIPSKLLSYPLCVEGAAALETVDFAKEMLSFFLNRQDKIDAVLTGFIPSIELVSEVKEFCKTRKSDGTIICVDPVFGDNGKAYKSVKPENIEAIKGLLSVADYCFPNYTEACILTGSEYKGVTAEQAEGVNDKNGMTSSEALKLLLSLRALGAATPIVTGCIVDNEDVIIYLDADNKLGTVTYRRVMGHLAGTGDRFAAGLVGGLLNGETLSEAVSRTSEEITARILKQNNS